MSLIKEALDKAQKKTTAGTSSEPEGTDERTTDSKPSADPRQSTGLDTSRLLKFLLWSGIVLAFSVLAGFELVYLLVLL